MPRGKTERRGQKSKILDEATRKTVIDSVAMGLTYEVACANASVSYRSFRNWVLRGQRAIGNKALFKRRKEQIYIQFVQDIQKAEAQAETVLIRRVRDASKEPTRWQAAAWLLERRYPERYGRRDRVAMEHSGDQENPIPLEVSVAEEMIEMIYGGSEALEKLRRQREQEREDALNGGTDDEEDFGA